jgi:hypothetical protein
MTFADLLYKGFVWLEARFTRILAITGGTVAIISTSDVIPAAQLKYWMLVIAILTFWRGQATNKIYAQAKQVLSSATAPVVIGPSVVMAPVAEPPETPLSPVKPASPEKLD